MRPMPRCVGSARGKLLTHRASLLQMPESADTALVVAGFATSVSGRSSDVRRGAGPRCGRGGAVRERERAEITRSSIEAERTSDAALRVSNRTRARYQCPTAATAYPLEFAYHVLGDVRGRQVLELGCGSGANTVCLVARGASVCALDISEDLIGLARRRLAASGCAGGACFVVGTAHELPLRDASVDVVFGIAILHHLDLPLVSREVHRVLRQGGRAIFQNRYATRRRCAPSAR